MPLQLHSMPAPPATPHRTGRHAPVLAVPLHPSEKGRENEILLRDGGDVADSGEQDRLIWIAVDGDQRIRADTSDRHVAAEVVGGNPEGRDIQQILAASGVGIEVLDPVIAKPWREDERVRAAATVEQIVADAALEAVVPLIADQYVGKVRADDVLHATDQVALCISAEARDWLQRGAQIDVH